MKTAKQNTISLLNLTFQVQFFHPVGRQKNKKSKVVQFFTGIFKFIHAEA